MNPNIKENSDDVIDLTESFTLAHPRFKSNAVIVLDTSDESFNLTFNSDSENNSDERNIRSAIKKKNKKKRKSSSEDKQSSGPSNSKKKPTSGGLGECPICCDELGKNPLASTKCGHVYCLKCLQQSLKIVKKCPTCRCILKGSFAYHPLYINF